MGSQTEDVISTLVAETDCTVHFCAGTTVSHYIDGGLGAHVNQTDFMSTAIFRIVHDANLPAFRMGSRHVEHAQLQAIQFFCVVIGTHLRATH